MQSKNLETIRIKHDSLCIYTAEKRQFTKCTSPKFTLQKTLLWKTDSIQESEEEKIQTLNSMIQTFITKGNPTTIVYTDQQNYISRFNFSKWHHTVDSTVWPNCKFAMDCIYISLTTQYVKPARLNNKLQMPSHNRLRIHITDYEVPWPAIVMLCMPNVHGNRWSIDRNSMHNNQMSHKQA